MSESAPDLLKSVLALPPADRAAFAEELLSSLDRPVPSIDDLWDGEAEDRFTQMIDPILPACRWVRFADRSNGCELPGPRKLGEKASQASRPLAATSYDNRF
jgi:hypothetical protein